MQLTWASLLGLEYEVRHATSLDSPVWTPVYTHMAIGTLSHFTDTDLVRLSQSPSLYQVVEAP